MSSSRSIAAARNRRAGEQQPQMTRPGTSIAAQPAFSQQQQQGKRSVTAPNSNSTPNVPVSNASSAKLSISDAIGLITLRLGRVEQILIDLEHNGGLSAGGSIPDNTQLVDKSVINSIVNRLDTLEKREKEPSNNQQTSKLESEIRDIKDLLMGQILKSEKITSETNKKFDEIKEIIDEHQKTFDDFDQAISELEKQHEVLKSSETTQVADDTSIVVSGNLKSIIEEELSNSTNL